MNLYQAQLLTAVSSTDGTIAYSVNGGVLPSGVTFSEANHLLSYNSELTSDSNVQIKANSSNGAESIININMLKPLDIIKPLDMNY
jgi:hypothetical protein